MRFFFLLLIWSTLNYGCVYSQESKFDKTISAFIDNFKKAETRQDYKLLIDKLQQFVSEHPGNAEARYVLAYSYSRYNSSDANAIPEMKLPMVLKASAELEKVISLKPKYDGPVIALDPYTKLTSEWGCLALSYLYKNKKDSTLWAFKEGKKRGGFTEHTLSVCRAALNKCSNGSILISSGDIFTLPLYYLQVVEDLRKDVSIVDIAMLNAVWYPQLLTQVMNVKTGLTKSVLDSIEYEEWTAKTISIPIVSTGKKFSWVLNPSYENKYILRGDQIFLAILKENKFNRDVYFTKAFTEGDRLSLGKNLLFFSACDKLNVNYYPQLTFDEYVKDVKSFVTVLKPVIKNSTDELMITNCLRYDIIDKLDNAIEKGDNEKKSQLLNLLNIYLSGEKYPYTSDDVKDYISKLSKE